MAVKSLEVRRPLDQLAGQWSYCSSRRAQLRPRQSFWVVGNYGRFNDWRDGWISSPSCHASKWAESVKWVTENAVVWNHWFHRVRALASTIWLE